MGCCAWLVGQHWISDWSVWVHYYCKWMGQMRRKDRNKKRQEEIAGVLLEILASVNKGYLCRYLQKAEMRC